MPGVRKGKGGVGGEGGTERAKVERNGQTLRKTDNGRTMEGQCRAEWRRKRLPSAAKMHNDDQRQQQQASWRLVAVAMVVGVVGITIMPSTANAQNDSVSLCPAAVDVMGDESFSSAAYAEPTGIVGRIWALDRRPNVIQAIRLSDTATREFEPGEPSYHEGIASAATLFLLVAVAGLVLFLLLLVRRTLCRGVGVNTGAQALRKDPLPIGMVTVRRLQILLLVAFGCGIVSLSIAGEGEASLTMAISNLGSVLVEEILRFVDLVSRSVCIGSEVVDELNVLSSLEIDLAVEITSATGGAVVYDASNVMFDNTTLEDVQSLLDDVADAAHDFDAEVEVINDQIHRYTLLGLIFLGMFIALGGVSALVRRWPVSELSMHVALFGFTITGLLCTLAVPLALMTSDMCVASGPYLLEEPGVESPLETIADCDAALVDAVAGAEAALDATTMGVMTVRDAVNMSTDSAMALNSGGIFDLSGTFAIADDIYASLDKVDALVLESRTLVHDIGDCSWVRRLTVAVVEAVCVDTRDAVNSFLTAMLCFLASVLAVAVLSFLGILRFNRHVWDKEEGPDDLTDVGHDEETHSSNEVLELMDLSEGGKKRKAKDTEVSEESLQWTNMDAKGYGYDDQYADLATDV